MPETQLQFSTMRISNNARIAWNNYNKSQKVLKLMVLNLKLRRS
jgi:hypothetical protein